MNQKENIKKLAFSVKDVCFLCIFKEPNKNSFFVEYIAFPFIILFRQIHLCPGIYTHRIGSCLATTPISRGFLLSYFLKCRQ